MSKLETIIMDTVNKHMKNMNKEIANVFEIMDKENEKLLVFNIIQAFIILFLLVYILKDYVRGLL